MRFRPLSFVTCTLGLLVAGLAADAGAMTLQEAMERAAENTEAGALAALGVESADANRRTAVGALVPTVTLTATSRRNSDAVSVGDREFVRLWDHSANVRASVDLLRWPDVPTWAAAVASRDAAEDRAAWERASLRVAAARAYLAALSAAEDLADSERAIALREASLEQTEVLADGGFAVGADLSRASFSLLEAQATRIDAEASLADALTTLAFLTNTDVVTIDALVVPSLPSGSDAPADTADLRALVHETEATERLRRAQQFAFLPVVGVAAQYAIGARSLSAPNGTNWFVSFTATWDILDYSRYGRLDAANVAIDAAELELAQARRQRLADVDIASRRVETTRQRLELAEAAEEVAAETRALEAERFAGGDLTVLDLVTADADLLQSQIAANRAALDHSLAQIELAFLLGALEDDAWLAP